ncbi:hypothetical protein [Nonomuraea glycinis]|uniref:hypothetical protein n=1 Tax=Nonomuraea glycinis TaxID=2047744 RepID=UPI0033A537DA
MAAEDLADADPLPVVIGWLGEHPAVVAAFGEDRVDGLNEVPYPRLRVTDVPGGSDGPGSYETRLVGVRIQLEALGSVDGGPGKHELRRMLYTALGALGELPRADPAPPGAVVVSVRPAQAGGYLPEADRRPRYVAQATVWCHPSYA